MDKILTPRWEKLLPHPQQLAYFYSDARFNVVPAGRRSGKTERAKRKLVLRAVRHSKPWPGRYFAAAPTYNQAKAIYWDDLKLLVPRQFIVGLPNETNLYIELINGSRLYVFGMDKPQRIEGRPWDGGILDEYANMKPESFPMHVRPALSDRGGWCDFIGVPEGRNFYYDLWVDAISGMRPDWAGFTWFSSDILNAEEIESAKRDLDELTYKQEYEGSFVNFEGMAYYPFNEKNHYASDLIYDKRQPLIFTFDFNVAPGVANVIQEQQYPDKGPYAIADPKRQVTGIIDEVHIERNSTTPAVCRKLIAMYGRHEGRVTCYGDATGGAKGSAKVAGSDWDLISQELKPVFTNRLVFKVKSQNPRERVRINAVNSRLKSVSGAVRLKINPKCRYTVKDFEGVRLLKGGAGEIDKDFDLTATHHTDGIGYYLEYEHPVSIVKVVSRELML